MTCLLCLSHRLAEATPSSSSLLSPPASRLQLRERLLDLLRASLALVWLWIDP